jgi:hypothetical protein
MLHKAIFLLVGASDDFCNCSGHAQDGLRDICVRATFSGGDFFAAFQSLL